MGRQILQEAKRHTGRSLGDTEIQATREAMGWSNGPFEIPVDIQSAWDAREQGARAQAEWDQLFTDYKQQYPALASEFERRIQGDLPANALADFDRAISDTQAESPNLATRKASQNAIELVAKKLLPETLGGSADLGHSNLTIWSELGQ